jgi:O-antigen/teichoic acid export membrane protein
VLTKIHQGYLRNSIALGPYFNKKKSFRLSALTFSPEEWKYISLLLLNGFLLTMNTQVDRLMVSLFGSPETYSDYSLGTFANPLIGVVMASMATSFIPVLSNLYANNNTAAILSLWKRVSAQIAAIVIPLVIFTIFFGQEMVVFLFSQNIKVRLSCSRFLTVSIY